MSSRVTRNKKATRSYRSALRETHAEQTKEAILAAAAEEMAARGPLGFSLPGVAERSGVALRTVYRHFPTRDELVDAMWAFIYRRRDWLEREVPSGTIVETVAQLGPRYAAMRRLLEAAQRCERQIALRARTRKRRMANFEAALAHDVAALSPETRRRALGALQGVATPTFWLILTDSWCPDPSEASHVAAWALSVLLDEIRSHPARVEEALGRLPTHPIPPRAGKPRPEPPASERRAERAPERK